MCCCNIQLLVIYINTKYNNKFKANSFPYSKVPAPLLPVFQSHHFHIISWPHVTTDWKSCKFQYIQEKIKPLINCNSLSCRHILNVFCNSHFAWHADSSEEEWTKTQVYELQSPLITYDVGVVVVEFFLPNMLTDPPAECACAFYGPNWVFPYSAADSHTEFPIH